MDRRDHQGSPGSPGITALSPFRAGYRTLAEAQAAEELCAIGRTLMRRNAARKIRGLRGLLSLGGTLIAALVLFAAVLGHGGRNAQARHVASGTAVGVLILRQHPFCTASIVNSRSGNLIITAAHCLGRRLASTLMFAPSYFHGRAPFGEWRVTGQAFPPGWFPHGDINEDFAFLTVRGDVQARAGAERLGYSSPVPGFVRVEGYSPAGRLTICSRRPGEIMVAGQQQLSFACPGYASASSGGPFLTNISGRSGLGIIVGIIGGYQQGGKTPSVSYSSPFGTVLHKLYGSVTGAGAGHADG